MLHHMAMKQPHPGIVGNKHKIGALARGHQVSISKHRTGIFAELLRVHPEMMTVEMHAMLPPRVIPDPQHNNLAKIEISELVVISAHNPVKGP